MDVLRGHNTGEPERFQEEQSGVSCQGVFLREEAFGLYLGSIWTSKQEVIMNKICVRFWKWGRELTLRFSSVLQILLESLPRLNYGCVQRC